MASSDSTYGQKPLYYGKSAKSPMYYGTAKAPAYYGGQGPYYSGAYSGEMAGADADSLVGTVTLSRVLRVISQRWISVLVFLLIGLLVAFAVYRISPTIYEAKSEFTMDIRRPQASSMSIVDMSAPDLGITYEEIFNTRQSDWRSEAIVKKIIQQYRANYPASTITEKELVSTLEDSELDLIRHSRLITIAVRSTSPELAASLANSYAEAVESFTDEENKLRCDKAVSQIRGQVEKQIRLDKEIAKKLLEFRTQNKVDYLNAERDTLVQSLQKTTTDLLQMEGEVTASTEWEKVLQAAQEAPENFASLPSSVPRSMEIATTYAELQKAKMELDALLSKFTKSHPDVKMKESEYESIKKMFASAVQHALATATGNLKAYRNQLAVLKKKNEGLRVELNKIAQKIVSADAGLKLLEQEKEVSSKILADLMQKENAARIQAEQNNEIIRVGRPATVPKDPVLPNPVIIFSIGAVFSLGLGVMFVLVLDHLEDTVVSLSDIETRLALKVLVVLPHVRRKRREQIAKFVHENKYSQFAEAVAGLRNLLDSPRYQPLSQALLFISTQPGEGKTITSCSLAISSAQAGKRTLLVDFDLRRPRMARIWGLKLDEEHSFSHCLASKDRSRDFRNLVMPSGMEGLDVIASLPPDNVNPASIMGSSVVPDFFKWARANYDRVIIDSPPFGIVGDVVTLAAMVDSVMVMCCPDRTHFKPIQHAVRSLSESGANVIGIVVNDVELGSSGSAFDAAGRYGAYGAGYGGYGGYRGYRAHSGGAYHPYGPVEGGDRPAAKAASGASKDAAPKAASDGGPGDAPAPAKDGGESRRGIRVNPELYDEE